jgi:hypothetical protein
MTARYTEAMVGVVLVAFSAFALAQTLAISGGARIFPLISVGTLGLFSAIYLARSLLAPKETEPLVTRPGIFAIVVGLTLVYMNLAVAVGYITSTILYIPAVAWLIGFRRPVYLAVTTLVYLVTVYVLFEVIFGRALPPELLFELFGGTA